MYLPLYFPLRGTGPFLHEQVVHDVSHSSNYEGAVFVGGNAAVCTCCKWFSLHVGLLQEAFGH